MSRSDTPVAEGALKLRLIGNSPGFARQLARVPILASCDAGVLILGETGTGKELFAQAIHYLSARSTHPLVAVNCGALPNDLIEAEFFGHARGAYTSAYEARGGLIREAEGGTLFLDEVDSLPLSAQSKLLRFLQDKEYRPVGSARALRANVRIIAATNQDIEALVANGSFRRDLYYRINVLNLPLQPLRERREDIPLLAHHLLQRCVNELGRGACTLAPDALASLAAYDWPGNVRELEHRLMRATLLCEDNIIRPSDLELGRRDSGPARRHASFKLAKAQVIAEFERMYITSMLTHCKGNIAHAARASGKNRRAFWQLLRKHDIDAAQYRSRDTRLAS